MAHLLSRILLLALLLPGIAVCMTSVQTPAAESAPVRGGSPENAVVGEDSATADPAPCALSPLSMPPTPAKVPGYTELDPSTGLHVTGGMQQIDVKQYRLQVTGKVNHPLSLSYDDLRCMPRIEARPALICPGFFQDTATWAGTPLKHILESAKAQPGATAIRLTGADNYSASVPLDVAGAPGNFLAYEWERKALPALHGFPVRAVFPGLEGNQWVKWLLKIEVY
jgi:DMSO/TMAO reductase YedYZ molybdopterin-dependent catalytic subunit